MSRTLYALQLATNNLGKPLSLPSDAVDEIVNDPTHGRIAPQQQLDTS